jgi:hypothetical protein
MKRIYSMFLFLCFSLSAFAANVDLQYRKPGRDYSYYESNAVRSLGSRQLIGSAMNAARLFSSERDLPDATQWGGDVVQSRFEDFRDQRFLRWSRNPRFLRRISWFFPDDGCFARAGLAIKLLFNEGHELPKKIFAFGNLKVRTKNHPRGYVTWWYHTAPVIQIHNERYVMDPALEFSKPLPITKWLALMGIPSNLKVAICNSGTYVPRSACSRVSDGREASAQSAQQNYLNLEWDRLIRLGRDPGTELGVVDEL